MQKQHKKNAVKPVRCASTLQHNSTVSIRRHVRRMPLRRDAILTKLRAHEAELRAMGIKELWLFGSVARDEAGLKSDVDLMGKLVNGKTLFDLGRIYVDVKALLKVRNLDFVQNVYKEFRPFVMKDRIRVY